LTTGDSLPGWCTMAFTLPQLQQVIRDTFDAKDRRRGVEGTFMWFMEEVGELASALRGGSEQERAEEFADVLAWLATLANAVGVDLDAAVRAKYGTGCPGCRQIPCACDQAAKP
jgi:NTP pyrophosphatase (non-canonical NTP hydrolase)